MMQKIFLHIGTHKTATTWLQHYFARNSDRLNDFGFYYPHAGRVTQAQHRLGQAVFQRPQQAQSLDGIMVWEKLKRELENTYYQNIIISSEEFEWIRHPQVIKQFLPNVEIHLIVYLRRQDDYLESLYGQQIRDFQPRISKDIYRYIDENSLEFLDYNALLTRWSLASDNITVRIFDKSRMVGGDIGQDFLALLGINSNEGFESPTGAVIEHKASLGMEPQEFIRQCNTLRLPAGQHDQLVAKVVQLDRVLNNVAPRTKERLLSFKDRQELMRRYAAGNAVVHQRYLQNEKQNQLFEPIKDDFLVFHQAPVINKFETLLRLNSLMRFYG
ncbi:MULTISPECIES: hypothetical protein [Paracoccus]|uniref:hypothetical protein n=1 Tax=Paracoccus TaxID=265 RepID=UPI000AF0E8F6|nr:MULTISPECIES: hypothetical protein [Paracoccus]|tara:strand:- start:1801 stop:2787 length:987 start_codon:yes stop_codon:yes gene_type:complete